MTMGVERAEAQPRDESGWTAGDEPALAADQSFQFETPEEERPRRRVGRRLLAALLMVLAAGWLGLSLYALSQAWPGPSLAAWTGWAATISAPLILLALAWLMFGRTSRREVRPNSSQTRASRMSGALIVAAQPVQAARLGPGHAWLSA